MIWIGKRGRGEIREGKEWETGKNRRRRMGRKKEEEGGREERRGEREGGRQGRFE